MPKNKTIKINTLFVLISSTLLSSCTLFDYLKPNDFFQKKMKDTAPVPAWIAPLPHHGSLKALNQFWAQYQDPLLITLISAAEKESVDLATAKTRIMQARSNRAIANAALLPTLDATSSSSISVDQPTPKYKNTGGFIPIQNGGPTRSTQIGLQSTWELDLFGENAAELDVSKANLLVAESSWHEARVALAAEVATSYFDYRFCNQQLVITKADAASRFETARLTAISVKAGFADLGSGYLAQASDASSQQQVLQQQASCDSTIKELVALTNLAEADLKLKMQQDNLPNMDEKNSAELFSISEIPAEVIAQRPDVYMAEQEVMAAMADLKSSQLDRYPTISINGSIGLLHLSTKNYTSSGGIWSLGPLSISLPIFDGGKVQANIEAKSVKLDETFTSYRSKVKTAVKEVEQALVTLDSTAKRIQSAQVAAKNYKAALANTEIKYQSGFANIIELEDTRRTSLQADTNIVSLSKERNNAWISLYRAAGGGWTDTEAGRPLMIKTDQQK